MRSFEKLTKMFQENTICEMDWCSSSVAAAGDFNEQVLTKLEIDGDVRVSAVSDWKLRYDSSSSILKHSSMVSLDS